MHIKHRVCIFLSCNVLRRCSHHPSPMQCRNMLRPHLKLRQVRRQQRTANRCVLVLASVAGAEPSTSSPKLREYTIRAGTQSDARGLALVCAESFGRGNFPGLDSEALSRLEDRYASVIEEDMAEKLIDALSAKQEAQLQHREFRLRQYMQQLRAQLAALRGEPARFVSQMSPQDVRMIQRWIRCRQFLVLVAAEREPSHAAAAVDGSGAQQRGLRLPEGAGEDLGTGQGNGGGGAVVGCATLSLMQPEALLPPPFPSNKPFRLYLSNMAVLPEHRRRGLARLLLQKCEHIARLWGHSSLWLHVKTRNSGAAALYGSMGYRVVRQGGLALPLGPLSQTLMCKELGPLHGECPLVLNGTGPSSLGGGVGGMGRSRGGGAEGAGVVTGVTGTSRSGDGVFVWNAEIKDGPGEI